MIEGPGEDGRDLAGFLRQPQKVLARYFAVDRVLPPEEHLQPRHPIVLQGDDRLVEDLHFSALDRIAQVILQLQTANRLGVHLLIV